MYTLFENNYDAINYLIVVRELKDIKDNSMSILVESPCFARSCSWDEVSNLDNNSTLYAVYFGYNSSTIVYLSKGSEIGNYANTIYDLSTSHGQNIVFGYLE